MTDSEALLTFGDVVVERPSGTYNVKTVDDVLGEKCPKCDDGVVRLFFDPECAFVDGHEQIFLHMFDGITFTMFCDSCKAGFEGKISLKLEAFE